MDSDKLLNSSNIDVNMNSIILEDTSNDIQYDKTVCHLKITNQSMDITCQDGKRLAIVEFIDTIGAKCVVDKKDANKYLISIYTYVISPSCCCGSKERIRREINLVCNSKGNVGENIVNVINTLASQQTLVTKSECHMEGHVEYEAPKQRKVLVFVNPHSGQGTADKVWKQHAKRMITEANIDVEVITTTHANHAMEHVTALDRQNILSLDGIATVGGDGILAEVVNGIRARSDSREVFDKVPLIPIPGGTSNGLVKSILHESGEEYCVVNSLYVILKGSPSPIDMSLVSTATGKSYYAFLILGWGLIGDIDILSETMRWMGEPRLYVAAVYFLLKNRHYTGKLSMLVATDDNSSFSPEDMPSIDQPLVDTEKYKWTVIDDKFVMVLVVQTSHCSSSVYSGPDVTLDDGLLTIYVLRGVGRISEATFLLDFDSGAFVNHPDIEVYKTRAYRMEPEASEKGIYSLDGESIDYANCQGVVMPGHAKIIKIKK